MDNLEAFYRDHEELRTDRALFQGVARVDEAGRRLGVSKLLVVPCTYEKGQAASENRVGRGGRDLTDHCLQGASCADDMRCTFNGMLAYLSPPPGVPCDDDLGPAAFWAYFVGLVTKLRSEQPAAVRRHIFVLTTHQARLRETILGKGGGGKYCNGHVLRIRNRTEVDSIYTGKSGGVGCRAELPVVLPPDTEVYIVRHGEGYHNRVKAGHQAGVAALLGDNAVSALLGRGSAVLAKQLSWSYYLDAPLTDTGRDEARVAARHIRASVGDDGPRRDDDTRFYFMASSLRRAQQTTLIIYHALAAAGVASRSGSLDLAYSWMAAEDSELLTPAVLGWWRQCPVGVGVVDRGWERIKWVEVSQAEAREAGAGVGIQGYLQAWLSAVDLPSLPDRAAHGILLDVLAGYAPPTTVEHLVGMAMASQVTDPAHRSEARACLQARYTDRLALPDVPAALPATNRYARWLQGLVAAEAPGRPIRETRLYTLAVLGYPAAQKLRRAALVASHPYPPVLSRRASDDAVQGAGYECGHIAGRYG